MNLTFVEFIIVIFGLDLYNYLDHLILDYSITNLAYNKKDSKIVDDYLENEV